MGQLINNRYEARDLIGEGAMGEVYKGYDRQTDTTVAIKALKTRITTPEMIQRFAREGEALRQLNHPNIVKMLDTLEDHDRHFLILEYVGGGSLQQVLDATPKLPIDQVLRIGLELADALTRAHHLNIVHRDIKPANVLLAEDGTPRLTDFGIARIGEDSKLTGTGAVIGTMDYLSPEAGEGKSLDHRADIWSFGVLLYEMLTGEVPFRGPNLAAILNAILHDTPKDIRVLRPDVPDDLATVIERMMVKNRDLRLNSARLIGADLEAILQGDRAPTSSLPKIATDHGKRVTTSIGMDKMMQNLPTPSTPFVGRTEELAEIATLIADPACRLLTLLGPGGMGKTRLSIEAARHQFDEQYFDQDGVFFVALAPLTSIDPMISAIAEAVGFSFFGSDPLDVQLKNYLSEKSMLLVLDNFEHLMAGATLVAELLAAAPNLKILATSRERLNLSAEWIYNVQGLHFPRSATVAEMAEFSAVKLFLQSAERARPGFVLGDDNKNAIAEICLAVQGMPLAIELAAAWVEMLTPAEILSEIRGSLDFLETELRDVPERHRSIRAVFDYSWQLMNDGERQAFVRLSIFRGGFSRDAAQVVAQTSLRQLTTLVNKSLLVRLPDGRYQVHELLRQYGESLLAQDKALITDSMTRHSDYYLRMLADRANTLRDDLLNTVALIDTELQNIRCAVDYALHLRRATFLEPALPVIDAFYEIRSMFQDGLALFQRIANLWKGDAEHPAIYYKARIFSGTALNRTEPHLAVDLLKEAVALARQANDTIMTGAGLVWLSYAEMSLGNYDKALQLGEEGVAALGAHHGTYQLVTGVTHIGYVNYLMGNYQDAKRLIKSALDDALQHNNPFEKAYTHNNYGEIVRDMGEFDDAKHHFEEAHRYFKAINYARGIAFVSNNLGGLLQRQGQYADAEKAYRRSYKLNKEIGDKVGIGHSLSALGSIAFFTGELETARDYYQQSLDLRQTLNDQRGVADSLGDLGTVAVMMGNFDDAEQYLEYSLSIRQEIGDMAGASRALLYLGELNLYEGKYDKATSYYTRSIDATDEARDNLFMTGWSRLSLVLVDIEKGNTQKALTALQDLEDAVAKTPLKWAKLWGGSVRLYAMIRAGDLQAARQLANRLLPMLLESEHPLATAFCGTVLAHLLYAEGNKVDAMRLIQAVQKGDGVSAYLMTRRKSEELHEKLMHDLPDVENHTLKVETLRQAVQSIFSNAKV